MEYSKIIKDLAKVIRTKLTDEEFLTLLDVAGDYTTDATLYRELDALKPPKLAKNAEP